MGVMEHARRELEIIENSCKSEDGLEMQKEMSKDILDVLQVLCGQGHSGFSANYIINKIKDLWLYKPLTKLAGKDEEWEEYDNGIYQNKRCSAVFKHGYNGRAYYIGGYSYCEPNDDGWFTCKESYKYIDFPCSPKELETEYRKLIFPTKYISVKWANKFHLYRRVK